MLYLNERYGATIQSLKDDIGLMVDEAQDIIDGYWAFFKFENSKVAREHDRADKSRPYFATLAPVIEDKNREGRKPNIRWKLFDAQSRKTTRAIKSKSTKTNSGRVIAKALKPTNRGYTEEQLARYCAGWEKEQVFAVEKKLDVIRRFIDSAQKCIVTLERIQRIRLENSQK